MAKRKKTPVHIIKTGYKDKSKRERKKKLDDVEVVGMIRPFGTFRPDRIKESFKELVKTINLKRSK